MNPFSEAKNNEKPSYFSWKDLSLKPYNKFEVDPFTKLRIILACGAEFEAVWFSHQFSRNCPDNDVRRSLACMRRQEQQQQKRLGSLKPINEGILEHTIAYEQLAVELTAMFAEREADKYFKQALDFALLEDFDHLYRYADLLNMAKGIKAENLVGKLTEVMPGRPTIAHHRSPLDDIKRHINFKTCDLLTKLQACIITAAEQQTMNYYMNQANFYLDKLGRQLYTEIAMVEEEHVSLYGSLIDTNSTWFENLLMHEYAECYLYYSLWQDETDPYVKKVFEQHYQIELQHLATAVDLLNRYDKKEWKQVIKGGDFPELIKFESRIDYVRDVLQTVQLTSDKEDYTNVDKLAPDADFFVYQSEVNVKENNVASHCVIEKHIADFDQDYRYQTQKHPIVELQDVKTDNTTVGR